MKFQLRRSWYFNRSREDKSQPSDLSRWAKSKSNFGIRVEGETALSIATPKHYSDIVQLLMQAGARQ
jgi:hypothetical protein